MSGAADLSPEEREVLWSALRAPIMEDDPARYGLCLRLCGRRLLQRAGAVSMANGWHGSPHAFVLSRAGWNLMKQERGRAPIRQTA